MNRSSSSSKTKKPPELKKDSLEDAPTKEFIRELKKITDGRIYVYKWNQKSDASPFCIYIEPKDVERVSKTLELQGAKVKSSQFGNKVRPFNDYGVSGITLNCGAAEEQR